MGAGTLLVDILHPVFELMAPWMPGEVFPFLFTLSYGWRVLTAGVFIALVAAWIGNFLIVRNFSLLGEGLAHVSFAAVAAGIALGMTTPLWLALILMWSPDWHSVDRGTWWALRRCRHRCPPVQYIGHRVAHPPAQ